MTLQPDDVNYIVTSEKIMGIKSFHLNIRSARNKDDVLQIFFDKFSFEFDVVMLTETWFASDYEVMTHARYNTFFLYRPQQRGGGILLNIHKSIDCDLLEEFSFISADIECLCVKNKQYLIAVMYRPPNGNIDSFFLCLENILDYANQEGLTLILGGDFNIDMLQSSPSQHRFDTILSSHNSTNEIRIATRVTTNTKTLIDLFITNVPTHEITTGVIETDLSDHFPIFLFIKKPLNRNKFSHSLKRKIQNVNKKTLDSFRTKIAEVNWDNVYQARAPDDAYEQFFLLFSQAYFESFPLVTYGKHSKARKPWISSECLRMIRKKEKLFNRFIKTRDPADWEIFKRHRNKTNTFLRHAKQNYLFHYFDLGCHKKPEAIWRKINELLNRVPTNTNIKEIMLNNKRVYGKELAEMFNDYFVNLVSSSHYAEAAYSVNRNQNCLFLAPTCENEIIHAFSSFSNSATCDIDNVQIRPVKHILDLIASPLMFIYNLALSTGQFPKKMQVSRVTVIFKGGDKNSLSNYRPISILPVFSKGLEKIIHTRITNFADKFHLISPAQFGFRKHRSTELALLAQKELILKAFEEKLLVIGIYIDFSKAFDRLNHLTLLKKRVIWHKRHWTKFNNFISTKPDASRHYRRKPVNVSTGMCRSPARQHFRSPSFQLLH